MIHVTLLSVSFSIVGQKICKKRSMNENNVNQLRKFIPPKFFPDGHTMNDDNTGRPRLGFEQPQTVRMGTRNSVT